MPDRKKGVLIKPVQQLYIPPIEIYFLTNGIKVYEINLGSQDIIKMEIIHEAGRSTEHQKLISKATASLMREGTDFKSSSEIADEIDYYGSSIKTASNMDFSYSTLYSLSKYAGKGIRLMHEIYTQPTFPEDEIEKFKKLNIQKLKEELGKNEVLSYRQITDEIFGKDHAYGYNSTEESYKLITREEIIRHYTQRYGTNNCTIILSGKITDTIRKEVINLFGSFDKPITDPVYTPVTTSEVGRKVQIYSKNEHQNAIKTGFRLFDVNHTDQSAFYLTNAILGGYFGSRLMTSIREESGYTYDIYSTVDQMLHDGCFYVSTEAAPEYTESILKEVLHQMDVLKNEPVSSKELNMVKNYLMGNFMNVLDGPVNVSSFVKSMLFLGREPTDFLSFSDEIMQITSDTIMHTAQEYFKEENMIEVIVASTE